MGNRFLVADRPFESGEAVDVVTAYAYRFPRTLEIFDGLGERGYDDPEPDRVTLADIARLVVINGRPEADDVPALLDADSSILQEIPRSADLRECEVGDDLWLRASALYDAFRIDNIGPAKRSKILHAKRPGLFFISDSRTVARYKDASDRAGSYWAAARRDLLQDGFVQLIETLATSRVETGEAVLSLGHLTPLRVLDILCWSE